MKKLGKKIDGVLDAIYGNKTKGRWIKILVTLFTLIVMITIPVFLITKLGYKDGEFYLKPWDVTVEVKKESK